MTITYRRVNHVTVAVPADEQAKVRAFYGGVLGLKEVKRPEALGAVYDIIWYELLDVLLHIDFTPPWTTPAENRHIALEVKNLDKVRTYLEENGSKSGSSRDSRSTALLRVGPFWELLRIHRDEELVLRNDSLRALEKGSRIA
jgi:hypothetical protein